MWIWVIVILGLLALAIEYWYITLALIAISIVVKLVVKSVKEENEKEKQRQLAIAQQQAAEKARLAKQQADEEARLQRYINQQHGYRNELIALCEHSIDYFESLPKYLISAEKYLDQAKVDFDESAFVPFWESIEHATMMLGRFVEGVHHIKDCSSFYTEMIKKYEGTPPQFPIAHQSVAKLGVGEGTAKRMEATVRTAHRKHEFATIYMQYRTNQILVAGFTNLSQALDRMTWSISASINTLSGSIGVMTKTLNESMGATHQRISEMAEMADHHHVERAKMAEQHHKELVKDTSERAAREKKALEMFDNIQRGRRPYW